MLGGNPSASAVPSAGRHGFTLLELLVAMAIAGILVTAAIPGFSNLITSSRLTTQANELLAALSTARAEAIKRNQRVILCRNDSGDSCSGSSGAWAGWLVFVDSNRDGVRDAAEPILQRGTLPAGTQLQVSTSISSLNNLIVFRPDGLAKDNAAKLLEGALSVCRETKQPKENIRLVAINAGSRMGVQKAEGSGSCPVPSV